MPTRRPAKHERSEYCAVCDSSPSRDGPSGAIGSNSSGTYACGITPHATTTASVRIADPLSTWSSKPCPTRATLTTCAGSTSGTWRAANQSPYSVNSSIGIAFSRINASEPASAA